MRLLLVGAFPYPHHQGSQVYFKEQAIALRAGGAEVSILTYGSMASSPGNPRTAEHWRALDGFERLTSPAWTSPGSGRSGPSFTKPLGDLGLAMTLRDAVASRRLDDAYDAILTHNAEAALVALHALPNGRNDRPAIVYCVHTLLENELSAYLRGPKRQGIMGSITAIGGAGGTARPLLRGIDRIGGGIDRWIARRVDGWISLTHSSERVMRQFSNAPGALIPPPLPDPGRAVESLNPAEVARRHGLEAGRFFLYSGNLDGYQELDILGAAAAELRRRGGRVPPIVIAHHAVHHGKGVRGAGKSASPTGHKTGWSRAMPGVEIREIDSAGEMQALVSAARASLVMRRAKGGFPIKLANSLAQGTPILAFHDREWGLSHEQDCLICDPDRPSIAMAEAIERLAKDDILAEKLGAGARALYLHRHLPEHAATKTLALLREVEAFRKR